jgi:hypothetical protein
MSMPQAGFEDALLVFRQMPDSAKCSLQYRNPPTKLYVTQYFIAIIIVLLITLPVA